MTYRIQSFDTVPISWETVLGLDREIKTLFSDFTAAPKLAYA